ncbi:MAG: FapA family protein [Methylobacter sp.]|nr:FapA family protein [Methylobacter sp.]
MNDASLTDVLTFKLNDDGKLLAAFEPCESKPPMDEAAIKAALARQGLSNLFLYENSLSNLVQQYNSLNESFVLEIGERRDGACTIKITDDKMAASLTLIPPYGGAPVGLFQIQLALQEKGVVGGIMKNEIEAALKEGYAKERIIAKGLPPVRGTDARFQSLVPQIRERKPRVDEHGVADYRDLGQLIVVRPGDPLMCRTPPTEGKKGRDVTGQILMPQPGQDTPFASGLQGVELDPDTELDPDNNSLLLAAIAGQPKLVPNGVIVEPTIDLPLVDISTGNMSFDGTINIKGDVKEGMKICASGDVFVGGTVEAAEIEAGGNVVIKGGVIGHSEHSGDPHEIPNFNARIISKGSISVHFAENVCMEAGTDIFIEEFSMHNHLTALNRILVGKSGSKKGRIIGGITCASVLVKAAVMGSNAGFITRIKAGFNPYLQAQLDKLKLEIDANEKELEDLKKIIAFVLAHPEKDKNGLLNKALHTREKVETDCTRLHAERAHLLSEMTLAENVQVIVEDSVHCGVEIQIGNSIWKNNEERGKGVFQIADGAIDFGNIMLSVDRSQ